VALREEAIEAFVTGQQSGLSDEIRRKAGSYFERQRSELSQYGRLVLDHHHHTHLRRTGVEPVHQRKSGYVPFMISLVPPDVYPSGEMAGSMTISSPQDASVKIDFRPKTIIRPEITGGNNSVTKREFFTDGSPERATLVSSAQERGAEYDTDVRGAYRAFQSSYRRASKNQKDRSVPVVAGRRPMVDDHVEHGQVEPGNSPFANERYLRAQAEQMQDLDPLFLYINPASFDKSYAHVVSESRTRYGHIVEQWGTEMPTISASGQIGAFMVNFGNSQGEGTGGLAVNLRRGSYAYQNLMSLYQVYRNNGYLYNIQKVPALVGAVRIFYDGAIYTGSFDSFSISQSEDSPFTLEYDFEFTVRFEQSLGPSPHV